MRRVILAPEPYHPIRERLKRLQKRADRYIFAALNGYSADRQEREDKEDWVNRKIEEAVNGR
jgi:hypothetical protein